MHALWPSARGTVRGKSFCSTPPCSLETKRISLPLLFIHHRFIRPYFISGRYDRKENLFLLQFNWIIRIILEIKASRSATLFKLRRGRFLSRTRRKRSVPAPSCVLNHNFSLSLPRCLLGLTGVHYLEESIDLSGPGSNWYDAVLCPSCLRNEYN